VSRGSWFYDEQQIFIGTHVYQLMSNTRKLITLDWAIKRLPLTAKIATMAASLPDIHRDPVDRFIVSNSLC